MHRGGFSWCWQWEHARSWGVCAIFDPPRRPNHPNELKPQHAAYGHCTGITCSSLNAGAATPRTLPLGTLILQAATPTSSLPIQARAQPRPRPPLLKGRAPQATATARAVRAAAQARARPRPGPSLLRICAPQATANVRAARAPARARARPRPGPAAACAPAAPRPAAAGAWRTRMPH